MIARVDRTRKPDLTRGPVSLHGIEAARYTLGLPLAELWLDYLALGGNLPPAAIGAALSGRAGLGDHDHDILVQALNEHFIDRAQNHPSPTPTNYPRTVNPQIFPELAGDGRGARTARPTSRRTVTRSVSDRAGPNV